MKAELSDIGALVQLRLEYLEEDSGSLSDQDAAVIAEHLPGYFERHLNRDLFCYIIREGREIAACAFLLAVEKPMSPAFINGKTGTVLNVYTRPAFRHRGYAGKLMKELLSDAAEMNISTIELKSTEMGYQLYHSAGFRDDDSHYHRMKWKNDRLKTE